MPIKEAHILECYEAYINGLPCPYPQGMNVNSAKMTMRWLDSILNDIRWNRGFSAMQCEVVLAQIQATLGNIRVSEVALSIQQDINLRFEIYGISQNAHRRVVAQYLNEEQN